MPDQIELSMAIEACRPASSDLDAPELAALRAAIRSDPAIARKLEAIGRFDERLGELVRQGDVPPGTEVRILAALVAADSRETDQAEPAEPIQPIAASPKRRTRRLWAAAAIAATLTAVATGLVVWSVLVGGEALTMTAVQEHAADWCDALPSRWRATLAPKDFPFPTDVTQLPKEWQPAEIPGLQGRVLAYRLRPPAGVRQMTLFVLKAPVSGVPRFPPSSPYKTQDRLVATWQVGKLVYMLVIQGDDLDVLQDVYERHVKTQPKVA